ncbi:MAG: hypothetical protein A2279_14010 [Stygiobacter sp. RIFOXYA12_FULL_38_9]|nr:MAG: hypothetical protein A2279_14010 [Stygiobacter sp. RIFOXYA12_FULL_38_9]OGV08493.1 MAG: hypothetical protein A2299_00370 [Stygiobacter sp. RIFOXYB2_FULL_37_11]OGV13507.1 MAG: hypothetical protein A2237_17195 [Stygiobacter sp. RIFOXYA2_FULL_38_8]OGV14799.1 MAG: hypothetical protein A2440_09875 [Stygiobacter sp. RIFOXYC2_FULL_38_25]OGV79292.1 MAG: hypothetical protein A2X65_02245 [Stygiobacter sp. GWF2_38_21]
MREFDICSFLLTEKNEKIKAANPWLSISFEMLWKLNFSPEIIIAFWYRDTSNRNFHLTHFSFILLTPSI